MPCMLCNAVRTAPCPQVHQHLCDEHLHTGPARPARGRSTGLSGEVGASGAVQTQWLPGLWGVLPAALLHAVGPCRGALARRRGQPSCPRRGARDRLPDMGGCKLPRLGAPVPVHPAPALLARLLLQAPPLSRLFRVPAGTCSPLGGLVILAGCCCRSSPAWGATGGCCPWPASRALLHAGLGGPSYGRARRAARPA